MVPLCVRAISKSNREEFEDLFLVRVLTNGKGVQKLRMSTFAYWVLTVLINTCDQVLYIAY